MYRNYFSQYLLKKNLAIMIIILFTCFWIVGCSEEKQINEGNEAAVSTVDKNITAIHTVIEQEFTGPNDKYVRLQKDIDTKTEELMSNLPEGANGVSTGGTKEWKAYEEFVEKTYKPYFTDNAFDKLISTNFAFSFLYRFTWPEYVDYKMSVSNIIIKQEKEHPFALRMVKLEEFSLEKEPKIC